MPGLLVSLGKAGELTDLTFTVPRTDLDVARDKALVIARDLEAGDVIVDSGLVKVSIVGLGIGPAVAMHEGSTLLVVFNALRLLAYREG